jgi:hypothetical protein
MKDEESELVELLRREETARVSHQPPSPPPLQQTIYHTELPEDTSDSPGARDWNCYRREVGRLLAEGHEGKWVLVKGGEILGIWDIRDEAKAAALERYLMQPVLLRQVLTWEPVLRGPTSLRPWRS